MSTETADVMSSEMRESRRKISPFVLLIPSYDTIRQCRHYTLAIGISLFLTEMNIIIKTPPTSVYMQIQQLFDLYLIKHFHSDSICCIHI